MSEKLTSLQRQRRQFHLFTWSGALLVVGIVALINFIASFIPLRLDTSRGQAYSISSGSKEILKKLDDTLVVKVAFSSQLPALYRLNQTYLMDLLSEYKRASHGKIRIENLDPSSNPQAKAEAISLGVAPVQLDVRERDRREVKECFMGVGFLYGDKRESIAIVQDIDNLEYEITVRLKRLVNPERATLGFVSSGGGLTLNSKSLESLSAPLRQLYDIQDVDLLNPVPPVVKALWLMGPSKQLTAQELENLKKYSSSGGFVGLLLNKQDIQIEQFRPSPVDAGLDDFLADWGLKMDSGLVVDDRCDRIQVQAVQGAYRMINIVDYPYMPWSSDLDRKHPVTKNLDGISLPFVSPIRVEAGKSGYVYTALAKSSNASYLDQRPYDLNPLRQHYPSADSPKGPFNLGMLVENGASRLLVFGTSRFVQSEYPARSSNYGMFGNMIDWSVQDEALIQIRSKGLSKVPLKVFPDGVRLGLKYLMILSLPLMSLLAGIWVWRTQKMRRALLPLRYQEG